MTRTTRKPHADNPKILLEAEPPTPKGKPGAAFERLAAAVHKKLDPGAQVRWNEFINGCQIDASIRGTIGGVPLLVIVECRDYKTTLGIDHVRNLSSVQKETVANKAILVTRTGFTKPALKLAAERGIDTCVLRPAESEDWPGPGQRLQRFHLSIDLVGTAVENVELELVDGRRIAMSPMAQLEFDNGVTEFIDLIVEGWLATEAGRGQRSGPLALALTHPPKLLLDEESPRVRMIRCTTRRTEWPAFTEYLWQAPEEWVFVRHRPEGILKERQFFNFTDLKLLAAEFGASQRG